MTSRCGCRVTAACALFLLGAFPCAAREGTEFGESVEVELVSVDVLATDGAGRPVTDLVREDFRLSDEGRPVEIRHFSAPAAEPRARGGGEGGGGTPRGSAKAAGAPDLLVLFLDQLHLTPGSRRRALRQLAAVLSQRLDEQTEVLVASFAGTVEVPLSPTRDRKRLWKVLAQEVLHGAEALQLDRDKSRILYDLRLALETDVEALQAFLPPDQVMDAACSSTGLFARTYVDQEWALVEATGNALREFLASLAAYPGRKTLVHVSDGVPQVAGLRPMEFLISLCDGSAAQSLGLGSHSVLACCPPARSFPATARLELQGYDTAEVWEQVVAEANVQRVTLYTLQALGLTAPAASSVDAERATSSLDLYTRANDQDPLVRMAEETGGRTMLNTNDFQQDLGRMLDDRTSRYELGFYPQGAVDRTVHSLELEVDRPGVRLRYRRSYARRTVSERAAAGVLAALYHGREQNRHRVRLRAEPLERTGKDRVEVDVEVRVPLAGLVLLPDGESLKGLLTVFAGARDEHGATLPVKEQQIPLRIESGDAGKDYRCVVRMSLPSGRDWQVAVALRDELGDETSYVTAPVRLTDRERP